MNEKSWKADPVSCVSLLSHSVPFAPIETWQFSPASKRSKLKCPVSLTNKRQGNGTEREKSLIAKDLRDASDTMCGSCSNHESITLNVRTYIWKKRENLDTTVYLIAKALLIFRCAITTVLKLFHHLKAHTLWLYVKMYDYWGWREWVKCTDETGIPLDLITASKQ